MLKERLCAISCLAVLISLIAAHHLSFGAEMAVQSLSVGNTWATASTEDEVKAALASGVKEILLTNSITTNTGINLRGATLRGAGAWGAGPTITVAGACFGIILGDNGRVENLNLTGTPSALGGIKTEGLTIGGGAYVRIINFSKGVGLYAFKSERSEWRHMYILDSYTGLLLEDNTTFEMIGGEIHNCFHKAVDTAGLGIYAVFDSVYFGANAVPVTVDLTGASLAEVTFRGCGFEGNGRGQDSPVNIKHHGARPLAVKDTNFQLWWKDITGNPTDIYAMGINTLVENCGMYELRPSAYTSRRFIYATHDPRFSVPASLTMISNTLQSNSLTNDQLAAGVQVDRNVFYSVVEKNTRIYGSDVAEKGALILNQDSPYATANVAKSSYGTDETDLWSAKIYGGRIPTNGSVHVLFAGRKTGSQGNKTIRLYIGSTELAALGPANDIFDWRIEADIQFNIEFVSASIIFHNGPEVSHIAITKLINTRTDMVLKLTGECGDASDSIINTIMVCRL